MDNSSARGPGSVNPETDMERISAHIEVSEGGAREELTVQIERSGGTRREQLEAILTEILDFETPSPIAQAVMRDGYSLPMLIEELSEYRRADAGLEGPAVSEVDRELAESRQAFVEAMTAKTGVMPDKKKKVKEERDETQSRYVEAVVAKLEQVLDADPMNADVGQLSKLVRNVSFDGEYADEVEDLAGNHLHVMVDVLLKEKFMRDAAVQRASYKGFERVVDTWQHNRWLRGAMAASIFGLSLTPKLHVLSEDKELIADHVDTGLQIAAGYIFLHDIEESGFINLSDLMKQRRERREREALATDRRLADLALRTAYNEVHYGTSSGLEPRPDRTGTDDPEENQRRFDALDGNFDRFQNEPGGWPYTGRQVLNYASRLYLHRMKQVEAITTADNRRELYLELVKELLGEDLQVMRSGLTGNRITRALVRSTSLAISAAMGRIAAGMSEAAHLSRESVRTVESEMTHSEKKKED